jgi:sterol desaturase/sphingolipid hydroxylase (fatty acid hydroxylase superfamily)
VIEEFLQDWPPFFPWAARNIYAGILAPFRAEARIFWLYLLLAAVIAIGVYLVQRRGDRNFGIKGMFRYLLPYETYTHASAVIDYKIFFVNALLRPISSLAGVVLGTTAIAYLVKTFLLANFTSPNWDFGSWNIPFCTLIFFLSLDFGVFLNHWLHHRVSVLWPIHRLHHTAEVLTPMTVYRIHPLYIVVKSFIRGPTAGLVQGTTLFLVNDLSILNILGLNAAYFLYNAAGANLRHTHVWLSYGNLLSHIFISPAQHQIHHSIAPEHQNCNFGGVLAIWDWMWGTLVLPTEEIRKNLVFGLAKDAPQLHPTMKDVYLEPMRESWARLTGKSRPDATSAI